jgi:predicted DsbA family dithiol-disulfide isomerase
VEKSDLELEIVSFTDPYCTWCWGSEPILRQIQEIYQEQVRFRFVMGGLVEDIRKFNDPGAGIGGEQWYKQVAEHWAEASRRHKMPVDEQVFFDLKDDIFSTHPACIAFEAAQLQNAVLGKRYLRRLREGAAAKRQAIQHFEVQVQLAEETGLDCDRFIKDIQSGAASSAFQQDLQECRRREVRGFPSFLLQYAGKEILLRGYTPYETFERWFQELSNDQLKPKNIQAGSSAVFNFISRYGNAAPIEVASVYNMKFEDAQKLLKEMADKGLVSENKIGMNGFLYSPPQPLEQCDPDTGSCSF